MYSFLIDNNQIAIVIFTFLLGVIIGSFLNTVIYRLPIMLGIIERVDKFKRFNISEPRSHCRNCNSIIPFYFNIPVIGYFILKGKCHHCKSFISLEYPTLEILTGVTFLWLTLLLGFSNFLIFMCFLSSTLIVIAVIDFKHFIIPNSITYTLICLGLLINYFFEMTILRYSILGCVGGFLLFMFIEKAFFMIKKIDGLGRGDAKFVAAIGAWVGINYLPLVIFLAAFLGILFFIIFLMINKKSLNESLNMEIPFGTFLAISCILIMPLTIN